MRAREERSAEAVAKQRRSVVTERPVGPAAGGALSAGWTTEALAALQSTVGNAAVVRVLRQSGHAWVQPEQHRHGAGCGHLEPAPAQRSAVPDVLRSAGRPLAADVRADMEQRLGADFSDVRIHNDSAAKASAAEVGARAYTSGSHVVVGEGGADKHTLAHELTHVIQQRQGPVADTDNSAGLRVSDPSDRDEGVLTEVSRRPIQPGRWGLGEARRHPPGVSAAAPEAERVCGEADSSLLAYAGVVQQVSILSLRQGGMVMQSDAEVVACRHLAGRVRRSGR
ncbi:DUF4157 domain-containing protein [Streptomyces sp. NPDC058240]|uniref:eCIS core domain-containing protein n=1 Tax=Streptomyces sp. NPDC058240 TaxID=3346396 RepID=UPI0036EDE987